MYVCVCVCVCVCVRACVHACVRACVRACVCVDKCSHELVGVGWYIQRAYIYMFFDRFIDDIDECPFYFLWGGGGGGGCGRKETPFNVLYCILTLYPFTLGHVWKLANAPMRI